MYCGCDSYFHTVSDTMFEIGQVDDVVDLQEWKDKYDAGMHSLSNDKKLIFKYINDLEGIVEELEE